MVRGRAPEPARAENETTDDPIPEKHKADDSEATVAPKPAKDVAGVKTTTATQVASSPVSKTPKSSQPVTATNFTAITSFTGAFDFLSMEFPCNVYYNGEKFPSAGAALQECQYDLPGFEDGKPSNPTEDWVAVHQLIRKEPKASIVRAAIEAAVRSTRKHPKERSDWWSSRARILEWVLRDKFRRNAVIRERLSETGTRNIVWQEPGSYISLRSEGTSTQNVVGRTLMRIRDDIKENIELEKWLALCHDLEPNDSARPDIVLHEMRAANQVENVKSESITQVLNSTGVKHVLGGKPLYYMGKLPENDVVNLNPSVSRRHAVMCCKKDHSVIVIDLGSKAQTFVNGVAIEADHVAKSVRHGDVIRLGLSSRSYRAEIDLNKILAYLDKKARALESEIGKGGDLEDPFGNASQNQTKLVMTNLPFKTTEEDLEEFLRLPHGSENEREVEIFFPQRREHGGSSDTSAQTAERGIAFVEFQTAALAAQTLRRVENKSLGGRPIKTSYATKRPDQERSSSGGFRTAVAPMTTAAEAAPIISAAAAAASSVPPLLATPSLVASRPGIRTEDFSSLEGETAVTGTNARRGGNRSGGSSRWDNDEKATTRTACGGGQSQNNRWESDEKAAEGPARGSGQSDANEAANDSTVSSATDAKEQTATGFSGSAAPAGREGDEGDGDGDNSQRHSPMSGDSNGRHRRRKRRDERHEESGHKEKRRCRSREENRDARHDHRERRRRTSSDRVGSARSDADSSYVSRRKSDASDKSRTSRNRRRSYDRNDRRSVSESSETSGSETGSNSSGSDCGSEEIRQRTRDSRRTQ